MNDVLSALASALIGAVCGIIGGWVAVNIRLAVTETKAAAALEEIVRVRTRMHDLANRAASNAGRLELDEQRLDRIETVLNGSLKR